MFCAWDALSFSGLRYPLNRMNCRGLLFATVPDSRINSQETGFIFNLQRAINKLVAQASILYLRFSVNHKHNSFSFIYIYTYLSGYSLQHLANMSILASSSSQTEPFACLHLSCVQLICLGPPSSLLFVPTVHISHKQPCLDNQTINTFYTSKHHGCVI